MGMKVNPNPTALIVSERKMYAGQLMGVMDLAQYEKIIGILKRTGLVKETNHLLEWIEPA